jgi:hypothetical protein
VSFQRQIQFATAPASSLTVATEKLAPPALFYNQYDLSDALRKITPSVSKFLPGINIFEILGELKELKRLREIFMSSDKPPIAHVASKNLEVNFGWLPVIGTVIDAYGIMTQLDYVVDTWNDFARKKKTMNFHSTFSPEIHSINWDIIKFYDYPAFERDMHYVAGYELSNKVHLYIKPIEIPDAMRFAVLVKALGLDKPITGIWELVPWSWVIDYFTQIGKIIDDWEQGIDDMFKFDFVDIGTSSKLTITSTSWFTQQYTNGTFLTSPKELSIREEYSRDVLPINSLEDAVIPHLFGAQKRPGKKQWSFLASAVYLRSL